MSAAAGKLGELLVSQGLITEDQLQAALDHKQKHKTRISSSLVQLGHVNEKVLATFLSKQYGIKAISLEGVRVPPELVKLIPLSLCEKHNLVPLSVDNNRLSIAISDPTNVAATDDIRFLCNMDVNVYIATESAIKNVMERIYANSGGLENEAKKFNKAPGEQGTSFIEVGQLSKESISVEADKSDAKPVISLINKLFMEAIRRKASDIHIEPFENHSRVRLRIDGSLYEVMRLPPQLRVSTPSRIKVMAQLDISEKRLPQDGRIQVRTKEKTIDVRVSVLPTIFGEKVVMRLLDQGTKAPDLEMLGMEEGPMELFRKAIAQPYGMVLVTGPTGSGKTTTLYAVLSELNRPDINISTVEDPVEYNMLGINQVQMKESIGMNFAAALRSLLRQDPDIIMVGEIRDAETAEIAVKSALTGHMVFSTLHTNDAPSTISRLVHMGLEPFLITASLALVQAQRLVRIICEHCAEPDTRVTPEMLIETEMPADWIGTFTPMRGKGCDRCAQTGFRGRKGIFEVMGITENLRTLIVKGANSDQIKKMAMQEGMFTLRQSGLLKLYQGLTTLEEVQNNSRPDGDLIKK